MFLTVRIYTQRKRRPQVAYSQPEAFALPDKSNKQQETYADMTYTLYPYTEIQCNETSHP